MIGVSSMPFTSVRIAEAPPVAPSQPAAAESDKNIVQYWSGRDIPGKIKSSDLTLAHNHWHKLVSSKLPRLNEFVGSDQNKALVNAILLVPQGNELLCVHHGEGAVKTIGANFTGMMHSEVISPVSPAIRKVFWSAIEQCEPFYLRFVAPFSQKHFCTEQVVLPLAANESRKPGFLAVYCAPLDEQLDVLRTMIDRAPLGMIAAVAYPDDKGNLGDGRVVVINSYARKVLRIPAENSGITWLRDLGAWFRDGALWSKTKSTVEAGQTHIHYRDLSNNKNYRVTIEPIDRFVLFSIIEIAVVIE